jgi:NAD(P)-dependent dehydrogenase (short-subunit alcohol dehydrogenase family)
MDSNTTSKVTVPARKVVLVAGGTGGLGRAVTLAFLSEAAQVNVTYRKQQELAELRNLAGENGSRLEGFEADVTDEAAVGQLVEEIVRRHGRLDAMVNAVGGYAGGIKLWDLDTKVIDQMLALNLRSGYALSRAAVRVMLKQGSGAIVNVAAKAAIDHGAGAGAYAASKAAAVAMIDSLAEDLKGTGIRVNSVLPSIIDTEPNRKAMPQADFSKWPKPEDIAQVIVFLCSESAKVIHGASVPVFGNS